MISDIFSLKCEALQLRFEDEVTKIKFIENLMRDGNSSSVNKQIVEIYKRFAGTPNFAMILSEMENADSEKINLKNTVAFCIAEIEDVHSIIDEISEEEKNIIYPLEIRKQLFCEEVSNEFKSDLSNEIINIFKNTDNVIDFADGIKNLTFLEKLDTESGKVSRVVYQKLFPTTCRTIIKDSLKRSFNDKLKNQIKDAVSDYLMPYISNFKKPESNHVPYVEILKQKYIISETKLIRIALKAYIYCGAAGLDTNYHVNSRGLYPRPASSFHQTLTEPYPEYVSYESKLANFFGNDHQKADQMQLEWYKKFNPNNKFKPFTRGFLILLRTLDTAIKIDFPSIRMSPEKLINLAMKALGKVNRKRRFEALSTLGENSL